MRFFELLTLVVALLQREGRVSYRALQLEFALDEAHLEALSLKRVEFFPMPISTTSIGNCFGS